MKFVVQTYREVEGNKEEHKEIRESVIESKKSLSLVIDEIAQTSQLMKQAINKGKFCLSFVGYCASADAEYVLVDRNLQETNANIKGIQAELQRIRSDNCCQSVRIEHAQQSSRRCVVSWKLWRFRLSYSS